MIAPLAAGVDEQEIAVLHPSGVLDVVKDAGVGPGRHDRGIRVAGGAARPEHELERRLDLVLVEPGAGGAHGLDVGVAADLARTALADELRGGAAEAQLVQHRARILDTRRGREAARPDGAHLTDEPRDPGVVVRIAEPVDEGGPAERVLAQLGVELVDGVGGIGAVGGDGALDARAPSVPDLHLAVTRTDEQDEALLGVSGVDHRDGIGLVEPGEEVEVGLLAELEPGVGVPRHLAGAGNHGQRVTDGLREAAPALEEGCQIEGHGSGPVRGNARADIDRIAHDSSLSGPIRT